MTEDWSKWQSQIINGVFPLRRFLGRSDHSVVFQTEHKAQGYPDAAIKLIPADPVLSEAQLSYWRTVVTLSHPHLIRLLEAGRCQLAGHQFLFVVMEYAEQTLAQILPQRALTADEVREMLLPTLDALTFLHRRNLVQGQLKPPNFLVVNDQLKLASDTVRPASESAASIAKPSLYDAPEARSGSHGAAGDIWGLGITLVEALTQHPPAWPDEGSETVLLPSTFPAAFADTVRRCLSRNPANRPTITDLEAQFGRAPPAPPTAPTAPPAPPAPPTPRAPPAPVASVVQPVVPEAPRRTAAAPKPPARRPFAPVIAVVLVLGAAIWAGLHLFHSRPISEQSAARTPQTSSPQAAASEPAASRPAAGASDQSAPPMTDVSPSVLHQEIPDVARSARESIHGHIRVTVRVSVDRSGKVVDESLEEPGSSRYFARLAAAAARKWRFAPADNQSSREWLVRFEFTRDGTTAHATLPRS